MFGPDMSDFAHISRMLLDAGGAVQVSTYKDIYTLLTRLLKNGREAETMGKKAFSVFCANKGAVEKTMKVLKKYL